MHINTEGSEGNTTKGRSTMKSAAMGCGAGVLLVVGGLAALLIWAVLQVTDTFVADDKVEQFAIDFVAEIKAGDYEALHLRLGEELRAEMSTEDLRMLLEDPHDSMQLIPAMPVVVAITGGAPLRWQANTTIGPATGYWTLWLSFDITRVEDTDEDTFVVETLKLDVVSRDLKESSHAKRAKEFHQALAVSDLTRARTMVDDALGGDSMGAFEQKVAAVQAIAALDAEVVAVLPLDERHVDVTLAVRAHEAAPFVTYTVSSSLVISTVKGPRMMTRYEINPWPDHQEAKWSAIVTQALQEKVSAQ